MSIKQIIKQKCKPFGFIQFVKKPLNNEIIYNLRSNSLIQSQEKSAKSYDRIFQWPRFYQIFDQSILNKTFKSKGIRLGDYLLCQVLRYCFIITDFFHALSPRKKIFYLIVHNKGKIDSLKILVTYTKGKDRENIFADKTAKYGVIDLHIVDTLPKENNITQKVKVTIGIKLKISLLKLQYWYVGYKVIEEIYCAKLLFNKFFQRISDESKELNIVVREGVTPINRTLIECGAKFCIPSTTVFTNSFFKKHFPIYTNQIVENLSNSLVFQESKIDRIGLADNPYINWRDIAKKSPGKFNIGFIPDMGTFNYKEKEDNDLMVVNTLAAFSEQNVLVRPHPQEMSGEPLKYYRNLFKNKLPNWILDSSKSIGDYIQNVDILITTSESSTVEQTLLCKRPVILVCGVDNMINVDIIKRAGGLIKVCHNVNEIESALMYFKELSEGSLQQLWNDFIHSIGFDDSTFRNSIDNIIDRFFISPQNKKKSEYV